MTQSTTWLKKHTQRTWERLLPRITPALQGHDDGALFMLRLERHFPDIFRLLHTLYGQHYDFFYHLEQILTAAAQKFIERPAALKALDRQREQNPLWFHSEKMMGAVCYVDLFAGDLAGLRARLPYLQELGITYLHLMPLFRSPEGDNDGGYAVSSYREADPQLGTMDALAELAADLREQGISLVLDFVFNHTSDEHEWALRAINGDDVCAEFYYFFEDRHLPDQYEQNLREIFPEQAPGSFTYRPEMGKWVWTTFHRNQWDLNYSNPAVFNAMLQELLFLANQGVEILRLDAVAFIWKELGTSCENLPQAHWIIQAFNALTRVAAPALLFKSEAIVHPRDVAAYISWGECPISYNPTLMALLWEALATREVRLLHLAMSRVFTLPLDCVWVNYVRVHDDIGWTFADEDAAELWINGYNHRQFLNQFYTGAFPGSFARGLPFNYNPTTGDMRISGTAASLAGVEQALEEDNPAYLEHALRRVVLIHSIILSVGGIPLLYLGDEIATLNDYAYREDADKREDSRWVHRPPFDWARAEERSDPSTPQGYVFQALRKLIRLRQNTPALANGETRFLYTGNPHVLAYSRHSAVLVLANFSEQAQAVKPVYLSVFLKGRARVTDLISGETRDTSGDIFLEPYAFRWLI